MEPLILVVYATKYGSTEETARMLAAVLKANGLPVEVQSAKNVEQWKPYTAVVLAAALYMGRLHKDARRFLASRREELSLVPVALVVPGPVGREQKDWKGAEQQLDKELARLPWLNPIERKIVGGKFDASKLPFPFNWALRKMPANDARDWDAIRGWAHELAGKLQPALTR